MRFSAGKMGSSMPEPDSASRRILQTGQLSMRIVRTLPSPPSAVFRSWTSPPLLKEWFHTGPEWSTPAAEVELRVGGHYRIAMRDAAVETLVVLQFRPSLAGSGTELELSHLGLLHEQMRDDHEAVWNICLDRLQETR
jgi:Activator of Hsp90 ATPase homolog 1-like protein